MAFNPQTIQRIRSFFQQQDADFYEKAMFGGVCFMVDNKMCCGSHIDKKTNTNVLMCRIGEAFYPEALDKDHVVPMEFTGKPMKGYVYVTEEGHRSASDLGFWLQRCLEYNPLAKASKKAKLKT